MKNTTDKQTIAIRCAFADLCGAIQARNMNDMEMHDWRAHLESIYDLRDAFPELKLEIPEELAQ